MAKSSLEFTHASCRQAGEGPGGWGERGKREREIYPSSFFQFHQSNELNFPFVGSGEQGVGRKSRDVSLGKTFHIEHMRNGD